MQGKGSGYILESVPYFLKLVLLLPVRNVDPAKFG